MRTIILTTVGILFCAFLTGCQTGLQPATLQPAGPAPDDTQLPAVPTAAASVTPTPSAPVGTTPVPTPTSFTPEQLVDVPELPDHPAYRIEAAVDFAAAEVDVKQEILFSIPELPENGRIVLAVELGLVQGALNLEAVRWAEGNPVRDWRLEDGVLEIPVPDGASSGEELAIELLYTIRLPLVRGRTSLFDGQLHLGDWYPRLPPYDSQRGWLVNPPSEVGETEVYEMADYEVLLRISGAPPGMPVAASLPCDRSGEELICSGEGLRNVAFSMSPYYEVLTGQVGDVTIFNYFLPTEAAAGQTAFEAAGRSIEVFSELFGPYPHTTYTVLPSTFPDGLEYDGMAYVGREYYGWYEGGVENYLYLLTVHEAAHQWWYAGIANDQAYEPWLDEALSTYSELLYLEQVHPELTDWWWQFRLDPFRPFGSNVNDPVYDHQRFRSYVNAVYLRGAEMIHELRDAMGNEAFLAALRAYADSNRGRLATGADLIGELERRSPVDLNPIFETYFSTP